MIILILVILLALVCEAFFSGAETAFVSVNLLKIVHLIERKNKRALLVHDLIKKPDRLLVTTLVGTNLSVVVSSACATALAGRLHVAIAVPLVTVIMTPLSFIFAQLLPKTVFRYKANRLALVTAPALRWSEKVLLPLVAFFSFLASMVGRLINPKGLKKNPFLTKDDIKTLIKDISREGILEPQEKDAIDTIFDLTLAKAADVMVPFKNVVWVQASDLLEAVRERCRATHFTRFPVMEGKALKGVVNVFDLFYGLVAGGDWRTFIRPAARIEHDESLDKVFSKMQPAKEKMAAVYKGSELVGILTMEDLMEEVTSHLIEVRKPENKA
jgi:CBS domain containing-hemolysin-like protein